MKKLTIIEYLDKRLGRHSGGGPEYTFYCPVCLDRIGTESSKKRLAINVARQKGRCFRCEFKFRELVHLFRYINGGFVTPEERIILRTEPPLVTVSVKKTVVKLLQKAGRDVERLRSHGLPTGARPLAKVDTTKLPWKRGLSYWERRGFNMDDARRFDVHFCPAGAEYMGLDYSGYLLFPVMQRGERVYWTTRYCGKHHIKSKNPPKKAGYYGREHCLLNYDAAIGEKVVTLVEGPTDCAAYEVALALLGKEMSGFQSALLFALVEHGLEELIVNLDPGTAKKVDEIVAQMRGGIPTVSTLYFDHGDPCSRRGELTELAKGRVESPTLHDRIRSRLVKG